MTPEQIKNDEDDEKARSRAAWLHANNAPKDWVILTKTEVAELAAALVEKQREVDQARTTRRAFQALAKKKHEKDAATIAALRAGSCICERCGLRQDGEPSEDPGF